MGDEVYGIALIWYATSLLGTNAGYISALQASSMFLFGLLGGVWADRHDHRKVMIFSDVFRGMAVLALPVVAYFDLLSIWPVIVVTIVVSSLTAFFTPALAALLPELTKDVGLLQTTNGLMETTGRFARIIGPGMVGLLSRQIPLIHYFTIDAVSFFVSAFSISRVKIDSSLANIDPVPLDLKATLLSGYRLAKSQSVLKYTVYSSAVAGAAWIFVVPLGMTLLLRERLPTNIGGLGLLITAYGVGNVVSNLVVANFYFRRPERWIFSGRLIAGVGIVLLSLSSTLPQMMLASALTAVGGPLVDLGYVNFIQKVCTGRDVARLFRYVMAIGQGALLVVYLTSPTLFLTFSVPHVMESAGILIFTMGLLGWIIIGRARTARV